MGKIIGLGGVFLDFKGEEQAVKDWYENHFSIDMSEFGSGFVKGEQLTLLSFKKESSQLALVNFRVDDLHEIISDLKKCNTNILSDITEYSYGYFAQIEDPFGNIIELWEPHIEEYKKMVMSEIDKYKKNTN